MTDLIAFLTARYDEEGAALERIEDHSEPWRGEWIVKARTLYTYNGWCLAVIAREYPWRPAVLKHIVAYDPARVLADLTAKRALLDEIEMLTIIPGWGDDPDRLNRPAGRMLRALASVYAEHPDFDPAWRTDG